MHSLSYQINPTLPSTNTPSPAMSNSNSTPPIKAPNSSSQFQPTYAKAVKSSPSRKQAILFPAINEVPILDYIIRIRRLIGPKKIISASKISKKRICIYLDSKKTVDTFLGTYKTIIINNQTVEARKLTALSRKTNFFQCTHMHSKLNLIRGAPKT